MSGSGQKLKPSGHSDLAAILIWHLGVLVWEGGCLLVTSKKKKKKRTKLFKRSTLHGLSSELANPHIVCKNRRGLKGTILSSGACCYVCIVLLVLRTV